MNCRIGVRVVQVTRGFRCENLRDGNVLYAI